MKAENELEHLIGPFDVLDTWVPFLFFSFQP